MGTCAGTVITGGGATAGAGTSEYTGGAWTFPNGGATTGGAITGGATAVGGGLTNGDAVGAATTGGAG